MVGRMENARADGAAEHQTETSALEELLQSIDRPGSTAPTVGCSLRCPVCT